MNEHELGDLLVRLHDSIDESTVMTPAAASQHIRRRTQHLARRRGAISAVLACSAVVSIAAGAVIVAVSVNRDDRPLTRLEPLDPTTGSNSTADPVSSTEPDPSTVPVGSATPATSNTDEVPSLPLRPAENDWRVLPSAPLAQRTSAAVVTVGDQLVVWGGGVPNHLDGSEPPYDDGSVLDITSGQWRAMATGPLTGGSSTGAALDGRAVFVDATGASASYDPVTDTWAPIQGLAPGLVQVVAWDGQLFGNTGTAFAQLGADGWSSLTAFGNDTQNVRLVVVGDELLMFGEGTGSALHAGRWDLGLFTRLSRAPSIDITGGMFGVGTAGGRVVAVGWSMEALAYDPVSDEWSRLPDVPGFRTKCQPQVAGIGSTAVVRMCGFVAVLAAGSSSWVISSPFAGSIDLGLHIDADRIVAGGATTTGDPAGQLLTPIILGFVTIDPAAAPTGFSAGGSETTPSDQISTHLSASDCALTVDADAVPQQTMADAVTAAASAPEEVTWGNTAGSAQLQCSSADAYLQALSMLRSGGERTVPVDATEDILALGAAPTGTAEELIEAIWPALQQQNTEGELVPQVALTWDPVSSPTVTVEILGFADDSVDGLAYTISGRSTPQGWVVGSATVANICRRGVAAGTEGQLCI